MWMWAILLVHGPYLGLLPTCHREYPSGNQLTKMLAILLVHGFLPRPALHLSS